MRKSHAIQGCFVAMAITAGLVFCVVGCASQPSDNVEARQGGKAQNTAQVDWSLNMECGTCHTAEGGTMKEGERGARAHVDQAQATCATCHTDEKKLASVHKGKTASDKMPKKLKATMVEVKTCQNTVCHNLSKDEMLALTANNADLIDTKGTQVNPHNVIGLTPGHADITCSNCHSMHSENVAVSTTCITCHHAGVYECKTCH